MRVCLLALLFMLCHAKPFFMDNSWYDPVATQGSTVTFGRTRFTILSPSIIRLECAKNNSFDDRASFIFLNRNLPVPHYTVSHPNNNTIQITTSKLQLSYSNNKGQISSCATTEKGKDRAGGSLVLQYAAADQGDCCSTCDNTRECTSWVYDTLIQTPNINCFLLKHVNDTVPAPPNRIFGRVTTFCNGGLNITHDKHVWTPQTSSSGNLNGTVDGADCDEESYLYSTPTWCYDVNYPSRMQQGLLSTDGWTLIDDYTPRFRAESDLYPWYEPNDILVQDWYFFSYERNYKQQLQDFARLSGRMALPPRSAFGIWWSRYYAYSEQEFIDQVLVGYKTHQLPLDVIVLDMDWHITPTKQGCLPWGGYTWNTTLFPNPNKFMSWVHDAKNSMGHALKLLLNIHPQTGIDHCQEHYSDFAIAMGLDPRTNETIRCDYANQTFVNNLFKIYLDADQLSQVDYWWTDYEGYLVGGPSGKELFWSNYIFSSYLQSTRNTRPLVLSRYGGLGNHRYPIGFSGDVFQSFITLQWEIEMTQTAANVLFGYWSHDIGGFHDGNGCIGDHDTKNLTAAEMYMRWNQFGAVSPIYRTHCDHCERRIWEFPYFSIMKDAMLFRNALVPYIYTNARKAYDTSVAIVYPLYYDYPNEANAYKYTQQYMFGELILAAPIFTTVDNVTGTVTRAAWLPPGKHWSNWNGTRIYSGNTRVDDVQYSRSDIPLFVPCGSVIPMQTLNSSSRIYSDPLMWTIFPGATKGHGHVYEDDGESLSYKTDTGAITTMSYTRSNKTIIIYIMPMEGHYDGMPRSRSHVIQLRGIHHNVTSVEIDGVTIRPGHGVPGYYINQEHSLAVAHGSFMIHSSQTSIHKQTVIQINIKS